MAAARDKKINQTSTTHSETKTSGGRGGIGGVLGSVVGRDSGNFTAPGVGTASWFHDWRRPWWGH